MNTAINVTANVLLSILLVIGGLLVALWIFLAFHSPQPAPIICSTPSCIQFQPGQELIDPRTGLQAPLLPGGGTTVTGQF